MFTYFMYFVAVSSICSPPISGEADDMSAYIQPNGYLTEKLIVKDAQSGVVGLAGTEIVISTDGSWVKSRFWGDKRSVELASGKITSTEAIHLARVLADQKALQFPQEFGETDATTNPNPHYMILKFGKSSSKLFLPPRTDMSEFIRTGSEEERANLSRFSVIVAEVNKLSGSAK